MSRELRPRPPKGGTEALRRTANSGTLKNSLACVNPEIVKRSGHAKAVHRRARRVAGKMPQSRQRLKVY